MKKGIIISILLILGLLLATDAIHAVGPPAETTTDAAITAAEVPVSSSSDDGPPVAVLPQVLEISVTPEKEQTGTACVTAGQEIIDASTLVDEPVIFSNDVQAAGPEPVISETTQESTAIANPSSAVTIGTSVTIIP